MLDRSDSFLYLYDKEDLISLPEGKADTVRFRECQGKQLLRSTDLTQAGLTGAELSETRLEDTDLSLAHLGETMVSSTRTGSKTNRTARRRETTAVPSSGSQD
jgi:uncharacterized protein YjbI with pentapeptide repeats